MYVLYIKKIFRQSTELINELTKKVVKAEKETASLKIENRNLKKEIQLLRNLLKQNGINITI